MKAIIILAVLLLAGIAQAETTRDTSDIVKSKIIQFSSSNSSITSREPIQEYLFAEGFLESFELDKENGIIKIRLKQKKQEPKNFSYDRLLKQYSFYYIPPSALLRQTEKQLKKAPYGLYHWETDRENFSLTSDETNSNEVIFNVEYDYKRTNRNSGGIAICNVTRFPAITHPQTDDFLFNTYGEGLQCYIIIYSDTEVKEGWPVNFYFSEGNMSGKKEGSLDIDESGNLSVYEQFFPLNSEDEFVKVERFNENGNRLDSVSDKNLSAPLKFYLDTNFNFIPDNNINFAPNNPDFLGIHNEKWDTLFVPSIGGEDLLEPEKTFSINVRNHSGAIEKNIKGAINGNSYRLIQDRWWIEKPDTAHFLYYDFSGNNENELVIPMQYFTTQDTTFEYFKTYYSDHPTLPEQLNFFNPYFILYSESAGVLDSILLPETTLLENEFSDVTGDGKPELIVRDTTGTSIYNIYPKFSLLKKLPRVINSKYGALKNVRGSTINGERKIILRDDIFVYVLNLEGDVENKYRINLPFSVVSKDLSNSSRHNPKYWETVTIYPYVGGNQIYAAVMDNVGEGVQLMLVPLSDSEVIVEEGNLFLIPNINLSSEKEKTEYCIDYPDNQSRIIGDADGDRDVDQDDIETIFNSTSFETTIENHTPEEWSDLCCYRINDDNAINIYDTSLIHKLNEEERNHAPFGTCANPQRTNNASNSFTCKTGEAEAPKINYTWNWNLIGTDFCDADNPEGVYCDATQFTMATLRKINEMTPGDELAYEALLMADGFSEDFQLDFHKATTRWFFQVPEFYNEHFSNYLQNPDNFLFLKDNKRINQGLNQAGKYRITIKKPLDYFPKNPWDPITISFQFIEPPAQPNLLYELPLNHPLDFEKEGYGVRINTNKDIAIHEKQNEKRNLLKNTNYSGGLKTLNITINEDINEIQTEQVASITKNNNTYELIINKAGPNAVLLEIDNSEIDGKVQAFYKLFINENDENPLPKGWNSINEQCLDFEGNNIDSYTARIATQQDPIPNYKNAMAIEWNQPTRKGKTYLKNTIYLPTGTDALFQLIQPTNKPTNAKSYSQTHEGNPVQLNNENAIQSLQQLITKIKENQVCIQHNQATQLKWINQEQTIPIQQAEQRCIR